MTFDSDSDSTNDDFRMKNTPKQKPIHEVRIGFIKAAIWKNETEAGAVRFNVTFSRIYKDKDDEPWKFTDSFGRDDLLVLGKVANEVHTWIFNEMQEKEEGATRATS
jgi:hypothetical protein